MTSTDDLAAVWTLFADTSVGDYSPAYDAFVRAAAERPEVLAVVQRANPSAHLPNSMQAAIHALVLGGVDHPVQRFYEIERGDVDRSEAASAFCDAVLTHADQLVGLMDARPVQTNEAARIGVIAPAMNLVAARADQPVAMIDAGTSAGLNLSLDQWRVHYSSAVHAPVALGPADSPLQLEVESVGAPPVSTSADIAWRLGYDRNPIDLSDPDAALWLRSLIWPGHQQRQARLDAAIAQAQHDRHRIEKAQAIDGLAAALEAAPSDCLAVVVTSWVVFYFDRELRAEFAAAISGANRPVAWISMEGEGVVEGIDAVDEPDDGLEHSVIALVTSDGAGNTSREFVGWTRGHGGWVDLHLDS